MKWTGDRENKCAVGNDRSVYTAKADGTLEIRGDIWKECPLDLGNGYCRRKGVKEVGSKGCKGCLRNPVKGKMDNQDEAISLAESVEKTILPKT